MRRSEGGFTIIELLVSITIMGIISGGIAGGVIIALKTTDTTRDRVLESADGQISSAFFGTDVQSAEDVSTVSATVYTCGGTPSGASPLPIIRFRWTDPGAPIPASTTTTSPGIVTEASYVVETINGERRLTRRYCIGSATPVVAPIASGLAPPPATAASVTCIMSCSGRPQSVTLTLNEADGTAYQLKGVGRVSPTTTTS